MLFVIVGSGGSGKSSVARRVIKMCHDRNHFLSPVDPDFMFNIFEAKLMEANNLNPLDRDSDDYRRVARDARVQSMYMYCDFLIKQKLEPLIIAPMSSEVKNGVLTKNLMERFNLKKEDIKIVYLHTPEEFLKRRVLKRQRREDVNKLEDWDGYIKRQPTLEDIKKDDNVKIIDNSDDLSQVSFQVFKHFSQKFRKNFRRFNDNKKKDDLTSPQNKPKM